MVTIIYMFYPICFVWITNIDLASSPWKSIPPRFIKHQLQQWNEPLVCMSFRAQSKFHKNLNEVIILVFNEKKQTYGVKIPSEFAWPPKYTFFFNSGVWFWSHRVDSYWWHQSFLRERRRDHVGSVTKNQGQQISHLINIYLTISIQISYLFDFFINFYKGDFQIAFWTWMKDLNVGACVHLGFCQWAHMTFWRWMEKLGDGACLGTRQT